MTDIPEWNERWTYGVRTDKLDAMRMERMQRKGRPSLFPWFFLGFMFGGMQ